MANLPGYYPQIKDGGLGVLPPLPTGLLGMIGVAENEVGPVMVTSPDQAKDLLGGGPLLDHLLDALSNGARRVVVLSTRGDTQAQEVHGWKVHAGTGTEVVITGAGGVGDETLVRVRFTETGGVGTALYQISLDNGLTWSEERLLSGTGDISDVVYSDSFVSLHFQNDASNPDTSFQAGDEFVLKTYPRKMSLSQVGNLAEVLAGWKTPDGFGVEFVYVVAYGDQTLWATLASVADEHWTQESQPWFLTNFKHLFEYHGVSTGFDLDGFLQDALTASGAYRHPRVAVNAAYLMLLQNGDARIRAAGGAIAGLIARAKPHWSIGWVRNFRIVNAVRLEPWNSDTDHIGLGEIEQLNDARYITVRQWPGYGFVPTDDWMMAPATSDFFCIRNRRIMDMAIEGVKAANMPYINSPGISKEDLIAYKADLEQPLRAMKAENILMDYTLTLQPDENIASTGIVYATIEIVPTPTKKRLVATFQLKAPKIS